jgi:hypothetical protein
MERTTAIKKLTKILGTKFGYRVNNRAATADERETAKLALSSAVAERNSLGERLDERRRKILAADPEFQQLHIDHKAAKKEVERLQGIMFSRKITVGADNGIFFIVKAEGDSWEEVIEKLGKTK